MKLLVVVGVNHFNKEIKRILDESGISIYSQTNIVGHNEMVEENLSANWFASTSEFQKSVLYFSFTGSAKAESVLKLVNKQNETIDSTSRIRAFIMPVETHN